MGTLDDLLSGGGKSFKFDTVGTSVTGTITSIEVKQKTEYGTGKALTWDDGRPQEQIVVGVQTDVRDDGDDDGIRTVYIKGWGDPLKAFRAAAAELGRKPRIGDIFTATYTGNGAAKPGMTPPKVFAFRIQPGTPGLDALVDSPAASTPAPTSTPATATPPAAGGESPADKVRQLIGVGLDDASIARAVGLDEAVVSAIRAA